jgi:hypothetical protein
MSFDYQDDGLKKHHNNDGVDLLEQVEGNKDNFISE